jgi:Zn-dependent protease with chaperone function
MSLPGLGLTADDFTSPGDRSNLIALKGTEPLPQIVKRVVAPAGAKSAYWLARHARRIGPPSRLDTLIRACGETLGLESLPKAYVAPSNQVNAFTTGMDDSPILVISSATLEALDYMQMEGLLAHELAHVRSKHVLYHTLAESLASGVQFVAPTLTTGVLALPIRMLLLAWYRESEVSADRAALLVTGDYRAFESLMVGLMTYNGPAAGGGGSIAELLQTHPNMDHRVRLAREYYGSEEYKKARAKLNVVEALGALATLCRNCGTMLPRSEVFCPNCGQSRR